MSQLEPNNTTAGDIASAALRECGAWGVGQTPLALDIEDAQARLQWMLQEWQRKRWFVWHLVDHSIVSTGAESYTIGPGGQIDTDPIGPPSPGVAVSARPNRIESSFLRQLTLSQPNQIDYPMTLIFSREDYNRIALKQLMSFPGYLFYDSAWPIGNLFPWPVPQPNIYELHVTVKEILPPQFATLGTVIDVPYEYYNAMVTNLAMRLRPKYGIVAQQGDSLPGAARNSLNTLKLSNYQISRLQIPGDLVRPQLYNIFSDRMY
jgi:hypothetical protein